METQIRINKERLLQKLDELAQFGALEEGGVSRLALSNADKEARDLTVSWMQSLDLNVHIDQVGNIIGLHLGEKELPPVPITAVVKC